jgi:hypothetical protein
MILTDEQKQAITDRFGACNWEVLEEAARLGRNSVFKTMQTAFPVLLQSMIDSAEARTELTLDELRSAIGLLPPHDEVP